MAMSSYSVSFLLFLSLALLCDATRTLQVDRRRTRMISVSNGGKWGTWRFVDRCPFGSKAKGFMLKVHPHQGFFHDDTALNGITLICTSEREQFINVMSDSGDWGSWKQPQWCPYGHLSAFRLRVQSPQGAFRDDTTANNIDFKCSHGAMLEGRGTTSGTYGSWSEDCGKKAICGLRTKIEKWLGIRDDTALNDVQFYCCE